MVEAKSESPKTKRRNRSGSSSSNSSSASSASSGSSGSGSSSSGSSSSSSSSSASSSSRSKSPARKRRTSRDRRPAVARQSRSPRRLGGRAAHSDRRSKDRVPHRRSPSPRRRISPERKRRSRTRTPPTRRASSPPKPKRISVRNLSRNLTKEHLSEIFGIFGTLKSCEMPPDRVHSHLGRGYGYVEYEKAEDAEKAVKHMDGGQIDGLEIHCEMPLVYRSSVGAVTGGRNRSRSPPPNRVSARGASPPRRHRRSIPRSGANSIPLGGGGGGRSRSRSPRR